ncbi:hypothetical protein C4D60_Mb07t06120 [Musa balbisiana]|uniref:Protein DGS1, mitochondrial n=1 Tax=Musa balbisiana TaxID=52838 RepID=A0A4S8JDU9_MUSBA|nr:hypothetical protein C4D60_Mb07t06120 [Musa balbisiana]
MASSPAESPNTSVPCTTAATDSTSVIARYSSRFWRILRDCLHFRGPPLFGQISRVHRRHRRRKHGLPLPMRSNAVRSFSIAARASRASFMLEDIMECILCNLHKIQKSLHFWQSRAEGTNAQKIYFMIFERGPWALIDGTYEMLSRLGTNGSPFQHLSHAASNTICHNIAILTSLQHCLANSLAQVYSEVDKYGEMLIEDADKSLPLGDKSLVYQNGSSVLHLEKIPEEHLAKSHWTDIEIRDATDLIYQNLQRLELYLSLILSTCQKPKRLTLYWLRYTCGAVGLTLCSVWFLRHSSFMGSPDIDNWIHEAKESAAGFLKDHVEQPVWFVVKILFLNLRVPLANNKNLIWKRQKGVMEMEEVQLTADSLHRMLLAFCEQTKSQKLPENIPDQEMLEIVMARYEKEVMHPLQNLLSGELARAMLIQIQKLKLDLETAMLELDQILRANEINFAVLAALPAFFLSLVLLMLVRAWVMQDKSAEGRGRVARRQRRLLVVEVERRLVQFQTCMDQGKKEDARCIYGMVLYSLDRLYKAAERHAKETGEWMSLQQDILDLAKPDLETIYKLTVTSRMGQMYDCLLPSSKRQ